MAVGKAEWHDRSRIALYSARRLFDAGDWYGCANRLYYAAFQAVTGVCVERGDAFANSWGNPSHEQVPELVRKMGHLSLSTRRQIVSDLKYLRNAREDADYRPGRTVDTKTG